MLDKKYFLGKRILITGIAGTVGKELARQLCEYGVASIIGFDHNESALYLASQDNQLSFEPVLGDIRDRDTLFYSAMGVDIIFHLAALKHVPLCEKNPIEAVKTNILGVENVIDSGIKNEVEQVINTSTDKAVNPFNVMGSSKLMGEQLIRAANLSSNETKFTSTRFGNVLGSQGSVVPIFKEQIRCNNPLTLTSKEMTRFVMTLREAVDLIIQSATLAMGGETYITKMRTIRILTLAQVMLEELGTVPSNDIDHEIIEVGLRPGEKIFEELMSSEEARRSVELEYHYAIMPALSDIYDSRIAKPTNGNDKQIRIPYNSASTPEMEKEDLRKYLKKHHII